jgi:hypothetical protein
MDSILIILFLDRIYRIDWIFTFPFSGGNREKAIRLRRKLIFSMFNLQIPHLLDAGSSPA